MALKIERVKPMAKVPLLVCTCGDCTHWEIAQDSIICKSCGEVIPVPDIGTYVVSHTVDHPKLDWQEHER